MVEIIPACIWWNIWKKEMKIFLKANNVKYRRSSGSLSLNVFGVKSNI